MEKLIITAAITGAETTKQMNPSLPITPEEQALDAAACVRAGAAIIHLHVRDNEGRPTQDVGRFKEAIEAIRSMCNPVPIIQISTGGAVGESMERRIAPIVELRPEMASLNVGSMNFGDDVFINHPRDVRLLAAHMKRLGIVPEVEVYDAGHVEIAKRLVKEGLLSHPIHYQFVLGVVGGMSGEERNLDFLINSIDEGDTWAVAGIGRFELPLARLAIAKGGFVRVGLEDNIYITKGVLAKGNVELVSQVVEYAREAGREVAKPDEARAMLQIAVR